MAFIGMEPMAIEGTTFYRMQRDRITITPKLRRLVNRCTRTINTIVVSAEDCANLKLHNNQNEIQKLPIYTWYSLMENHGDPVLFRVVGDRVQSDQDIRARQIVRCLEERNITRIRLMDGHGRMLFSIMHALVLAGKNLHNYTFEVYDICEQAHEWHSHFFPESNVISIQRNILLDEVPAGTFLYLNFTSIGDQGDAIMTFLMRHFETKTVPIMISFLARNAAHGGVLSDFILSIRHNFNWTFISNRGLFYSGLISRKVIIRKRQRRHVLQAEKVTRRRILNRNPMPDEKFKERLEEFRLRRIHGIKGNRSGIDM